MSLRSDIKANLVAAYETIPKVRTVSTKFKLLNQVQSSQMPYIQVMSTVEERIRANSHKNTDCDWKLAVWCYVPDENDIETWVELITDKTYDDLERGGNARDTFIDEIFTDNVIEGSTPRGLIILSVVVSYRKPD